MLRSKEPLQWTFLKILWRRLELEVAMRSEFHITDLFDCRVINLARHPHRLEQFLGQNATAGFDIERFDAIDGSSIEIGTAIANGIIANGAKFTTGAVGVAMSHREIWHESIARAKCVLVFEDDAVLRHDFRDVLPPLVAQLPDDWEIVLLGYNTDSVLDLKLWGGGISLHGFFSVQYPTPAQLSDFAASKAPVGVHRLNNAFGICAYAISPSGAKRLISACFPMDNRLISIPAVGQSIRSFGLDCMMNAYYGRLSAYACFTPLVMPINDRSSSSVQRIC